MTYFTPPRIYDRIIAPAAGSGAFLRAVDHVVGNPPYGSHKERNMTSGLTVYALVAILALLLALAAIIGADLRDARRHSAVRDYMRRNR
jgi:hypothetical protein